MKRSHFISGVAAGAASYALVGSAGQAQAGGAGADFSLGNSAIDATWAIQNGRLALVRMRDGVLRRAIPLPREMFRVTLQDGTEWHGRDFRVVSGPAHETLSADPRAARYAERIPGRQISIELAHPSGNLRVKWRAILRDGSAYLRHEFEFLTVGSEMQIKSITLIDFAELPDGFVVGSVDGSPIVSGSLYTAVEHPFAQSDAIYDRASASLPLRVPLRPGVPLTVSSVIGVTRPGQLRRDFLTYVERERAHPYRTFLHYNSWYDLGYFTRYTAAQALERIHAFGTELTQSRRVRLESFLFDDGWDDPRRLWQFNAGFPDGFVPLKEAAAQYRAAPGAWLSPWGGYGDPRDERLASAKAQGYGVNEDGLALSAPKYYEYFQSVVTKFIQRGGVNQFKLDGTGNAGNVYPGSRFGSDFDAAIHLIEKARSIEPSIYINLTTGTYPSPFWLRYCDSIWRGGEDHDFFGPGTHRQKWMTYRDADTYAGVVTQGPLYPLNSLMLHGLIYAQHAKHLSDDPGGDFRDEIRSYFGTGTQLQEMYITPTLLSRQNWDDLAQSAKWSAANSAVLRDTHWIGGDPYRLQIYGHAAWSPQGGIVSLRNPSDRAQEIALDVAEAFELPQGAPQQYVARGSWKHEPPLSLKAGVYHVFRLRPFEVLTLEALPH